jgi:hypothetical protein
MFCIVGVIGLDSTSVGGSVGLGGVTWARRDDDWTDAFCLDLAMVG